MPADDEPTAIEPNVDPRLLEALRPSASETALPALRLVTPDPMDAPTIIDAGTAAVTSVLAERRHPTPVAPSPASLVLPPPAYGQAMHALPGTVPASPDRPSLDRALQDRGRELTPGFGRTGRHTPGRPMATQPGADLGAIEPAVHTPPPTRRDSAMHAVASDVAELLRASRTPRLIAMGVMAAVTIVAGVFGLRASFNQAAPVRAAGGRGVRAPRAGARPAPRRP